MTTEIMKDPVVTHDGQVYERSAVNEWFRSRRSQRPPVPITSPSTGLALPSLALTPEEPLRRAIEEYVAARPELARRELDLISLQKVVETLEQDFRGSGDPSAASKATQPARIRTKARSRGSNISTVAKTRRQNCHCLNAGDTAGRASSEN